MVLHRLNSSQSTAFIDGVLNKKLDKKDKNVKDILTAASGDMVLKNNAGEFVVDIPNNKFKYKDNDEIQTWVMTSELISLIKPQKEIFPKYYVKFNERKNITELYVLDDAEKGTKARNAESNRKLSQMIEAAKQLPGNPGKVTDTFKAEFNDDIKSKNDVVNVIEYVSRLFGHYVHPIWAAAKKK